MLRVGIDKKKKTRSTKSVCNPKKRKNNNNHRAQFSKQHNNKE